MSVTLPPFQQLVDAHWRDVSRLAHALSGPGEGDDVAQQAWTQALAAYPRLTSAKNLRSWLLTITARCAMDGHRARARRPLPVEELPEPVGALAALGRPGGAASPEHDAVEAGAGLWARVRVLPERQRMAIGLRYVADLDHSGVAAAMGTTPAATRRLVSDALAALRKEELA
jgi:RNA polymerase sigma factor (sigma-70 family)